MPLDRPFAEPAQPFFIAGAIVRWVRGQEFAVETVAIEPLTKARLQY